MPTRPVVLISATSGWKRTGSFGRGHRASDGRVKHCHDGRTYESLLPRICIRCWFASWRATNEFEPHKNWIVPGPSATGETHNGLALGLVASDLNSLLGCTWNGRS